MSWAPDAEKERSGAFRSLLREVETSLTERVSAIWEWLPEPKIEHTNAIAKHCGLTSSGKGVLRDVLYIMVQEHARFRQQILAHHGDFYEADPGEEMFIDQQEQAAEYLAAARAEARLMLKPLPDKRWGPKMPWMVLY
jgi:hypothetical protein